MAIKVTSDGSGAFRVALRVIPGAPRDRIVGELGDALKIAIAKPPQDNAANVAVEKFLVRQLQLRRGQVALVAGFTSRDKVVRVSGLTREELSARLAALADG
jgi:uncharacterized protein (TIGR00251 family)